MHAATKSHLTTLGGQHGQESEEGEEGEERSKEDCEEDPQGRQEEEVSSLLQDCRLLDAGTSHEPRTKVRRLWSTKEGVGETSGQTAGSYFEGVRFFKPVRQKKRVFFVRCGYSKIRNFAGLHRPE
jgi:hypothetical protein